MGDSSFYAWRICGCWKCNRTQAQFIRRVVVFVSLDVLVKIADIQKERRALAVVQVGQEAVLDESPQLPFTHAEIFSGLPGADQAKTGDGGSVHERLAFGGNSGSRAPDEGQIIIIPTRFQQAI
ncbi:MAG: hypothetical protein WB561_14605 [Terracidiphilus sp.]